MVCKHFLTLFRQSRAIHNCQRRAGASPTSKSKDHYYVSQFHNLSKTRNPQTVPFKLCPVTHFKQTSLTETLHLFSLHLGWSLKYNTAWKGNSLESNLMAGWSVGSAAEQGACPQINCWFLPGRSLPFAVWWPAIFTLFALCLVLTTGMIVLGKCGNILGSFKHIDTLGITALKTGGRLAATRTVVTHPPHKYCPFLSS